ncbi:protein kinase [Candidatus Uabimicrobium sp. HlEnr_7]|uniref:protein kinase domain-containing protein n=1 Tax=Candidatus Uabimicrobium helgolandensis TaxID=3095367 RepID=UPI00355664ED
MLKSEDELVAKAILKKELVTEQELNECVSIYEEQADSCKLVDVLVDNGYLSRFQRDDILKEIDKVVKILIKGSFIQCKNCNHSFNEGLIKSGKRRLRCGMCGTILSTAAPTTFDTAEIQEVFPVQSQEHSADVVEVSNVVDIPGYEIKRLLGSNIYGKTYKASKDGEHYIVVVLEKDILNDKEYMTTISEVLEIYMKSDIPNTPVCKGLEFYKDTSFIVWEYIEGDSLRKILSKKKAISVDESVKIVARLVKILRYASEQGITHYNVCPSNIVISKKNNKPILLNIGLQRKVLENCLYLVDQHQEAAFFIAPEHVGPQKKFDFRTDMYALGLVFYNLLSQNSLFFGVSPYEIIKHGNSADFSELKKINPEISDDIIAILSKLLAPLPTNRYQSYKEILWHLQNPERVHRNVALTEIEEEIFEQPTEMISHAKKQEAIAAADREQQKIIDSKELEGRLRKKRLASRRQKRPSGMRNVIVILIVSLAIGYFVYDYVQKNQREEIAINAYKIIKAEYDKVGKDPNSWPQMKEKLLDFTSRYKEQSFYVDNVYSHLNELKYNWKQHLYKEVDTLRDEINSLQEENKFAACIGRINRIPKVLVNSVENEVAIDIQQKLAGLREEVVENANNVYKATNVIRDSLLKKYKNAVAMDFNPSAIDKEYTAVMKKMKKTNSQFSEGIEVIHDDIQKIIDKFNNDISEVGQKHQNYKNFLKQKSDSELENQVSRINNKIITERKYFNFNKSIALCNSTQKTVSIVDISILKKMKKILTHLAKAKNILISKYKSPPANVRVLYKGQSYTLQTISSKFIVLNGNKNILWKDTPSFLLQKLIKKVSLAPNISAQDLLSLSFLAKEVEDMLLFYSLLEASVRGVNVEAEFYQEEQDIKLKSKALDEVSKLKALTKMPKYSANKALKNLLFIKNNVIISKILRQKYNTDLEKIFARTLQYKSSTKNITFLDFDSSSQISNWKMNKTKLVNGLLQARGNITIPLQNAKVVSGLILFKDIESKVNVSFGAYELEIDGRSKIKCIVNRDDGTGRTLNFSAPINKWFVFSMYINNGIIQWQVNNKSFSFTHKNIVPRKSVKIKVFSSEAVEFENILLAQD